MDRIFIGIIALFAGALGVFAFNQFFGEPLGPSSLGVIQSGMPEESRQMELATIDNANWVVVKHDPSGFQGEAVFIQTWKQKSRYGIEVPEKYDWKWKGVNAAFEVSKGLVTGTAPPLKILEKLQQRILKRETVNKSWFFSEDNFLLNSLPPIAEKIDDCAALAGLYNPETVKVAKQSLESQLTELFVAANTTLPSIRVEIVFANEEELAAQITARQANLEDPNCKQWHENWEPA